MAPSTYYSAKRRPPSARAIRNAELKPIIGRVHGDNSDVDDARKMWRQLRRDDIDVGRDQAARLMAALGLVGAVRGKAKRTTVPGAVGARPADLVERLFAAPAPNPLWVADFTYVATWSGFVYVAFVTDVVSRRIVGVAGVAIAAGRPALRVPPPRSMPTRWA